MKVCVGCNKLLPLDMFKKSHPDFPTRSGFNYKCRECVDPTFQLRRTSDGKVERVKHEN